MKNDLYYKTVRTIGRFVFFLTTRPKVLHVERTELEGAWLLASNHVSPYDVAPIVANCRRLIDWVSITEVFANPFLRWFCGNMGAFPINRSIKDLKGVRVIYQRLTAGRVVGIFPEGEIRDGQQAKVLEGGSIKPGVGKIAYAAKVPIIPCVVMDTWNFHGILVWLPLRLIRYGIIFGEPLTIDTTLAKREAIRKIEQDLETALRELHSELQAASR